MSASKPTRELSPWGHALAGALGAVFANATIYPLDTIKTRIQAAGSDNEEVEEHSTSITEKGESRNHTVLPKKADDVVSGLVRILKEEGIAGYYKGFFANMLNTFSMQYAYFFFYSLVRSLYLKRLARKSSSALPQALSTVSELLLGAIAGAFAQVFTIPVAVIATRQQLSGGEDGAGFLEVGKDIVKEDGITGLWRGLKPGLVLTVNPAITYGAFERIKGITLKSTGKERLSPGMAFLVGAASKSLATVITYPYIMAKVRLQAKTSSPSHKSNHTHSSSTDLSTSLAPRPAEVAALDGSADAPSAEPISYAQAVKKSLPPPVENNVDKKAKKQERYANAVDVLRKVYKEKGIKGWYQGMGAQIFKAVLSQGILFMLKDQFESYTFLLLLLFSKTLNPVHAAASVALSPEEIKNKTARVVRDVQTRLPTIERSVELAKNAAEVIGRDVVEKVAVDQVLDLINN